MTTAAETELRDAVRTALQSRATEVAEAFQVLARQSLPEAVGAVWFHISYSARNLPVTVFALDTDAVDEVLAEDAGGQATGPLIGPSFVATRDEPLIPEAQLDSLNEQLDGEAWPVVAREVAEFLLRCSQDAGLADHRLRFYAAHLNADEVLDLKSGSWHPRDAVQGRNDEGGA